MPSGASKFRDVLRMLAREATPFVKFRLAFVLMLVAAASIFTALGPVALKLIVDGLMGQHHYSVSPFFLLTLYVISQWVTRAAGQARVLVYGHVERRIFRTLSERLFAHLMHLPFRFHLDRHTGAVSETLNNGLEGFQMVLQHLVFTALPVTAELATTIVVLGHMAPPLFLALFSAAFIFYSGAFAYSATILSESARAASVARIAAGAAITDGLLNYETVKYFSAESMVQERVGMALSRSETEWVGFYRLYARNGFIVATVFAAFLATTTWYSISEVQRGYMTVGDFVLVNTYMLQLVQPIEMLGYAMQGFSQGLAMLEKMLHLFHEPPEPVSIIRSSATTGRGTLEFHQVSLSYRTNRPVLTNISFRIVPEQTLGIVGPTGSGKSTIVRLLMRLLDPDSGQILLNDVPISSLALPQLRNAIAVVPQETVLFNDTITYNIGFGREDATLIQIQQAARVAHLHEFITSLPDGYDTLVGERGVKLSGGERQRVSIARAVLKSPGIYAFDEATSSLDSRTEQDILASLREIAKHSSTLVIAHRLSTVIHADEIVVLDSGRIVERGTHTSLLHQNGRYTALWRAQHQGAAAA
jgi:ATP-binding cassette subfamily B protein